MVVQSLDLKDFRGIKAVKEPIEFSSFNVLVGRNNCGKSSIIEALALLPHPGYIYFDRSRIDYLARLRRSDHRSYIFGYSGIAQAIYNFFNVSVKIEISDKGVRALYNNKELSPGSPVEEFFKTVHMDREKIVTMYELITPNNLADVEDAISKHFDQIVKKGVHKKLVKEVINPTIDEVFTEIIHMIGGLRIRKEIAETPMYVKVNDLGLGVEKALASLLWLEFREPKLVLWDDFESNIYPTLLKRTLEWLAEKNWQVVMATHSIDILYRLAEVKPKNTKVVMLRKKDDILAHQDLQMDELEDMINAHQDPRTVVDLIQL